MKGFMAGPKTLRQPKSEFFSKLLKLQSDGAAEECGDGRHRSAGGDEGRHELRAADLLFGEVHGSAEIAKLEVVDKLMIGRKAARWALELAGIVPVKKFADSAPLRRARDNGIPHLEQGGRLGMPQAGRGETSAGLKVEIKAGRVDIFAAMGEAHGDMRFVRTLVMGESRVTVDAKHGASRGAGIGDEMRRKFRQGYCKVGDETQDRLAHARFPFVLVGLEPLALIVALEATEKLEKLGSEVSGHQR